MSYTPPYGCKHAFVYRGISYYDGRYNVPGSGAHRRYYAHVYYCQHCLETKGEPVPDPQRVFNSYTNHFNATPGTADECRVPLEDRP